MGGRRQRRPRRPAEHEALPSTLDEEREVGAAAVADAREGGGPGAEPVRVEERLDAILDDQRRQLHRCLTP